MDLRHIDICKIFHTKLTKTLEETGYAGMTIPAVAKSAGVAVPAVYSIFGSKKGIVSELLDAARFGEAYQALLAQVNEVTDPLKRLVYPPRFARQIYESEVPVENLLRGAGMLAPELAAVEQERDCRRYELAGDVDYRVVEGEVVVCGVEP